MSGPGPRDRLRAWLPHALLLLIGIASLWWLLLVIGPIRESLLMGGSLALLTYPLIFVPFDRLLQRIFRSWPAEYRRYFSSLISTVFLAALVALLLLLVLWALMGSVRETLDAALGLMLQDPDREHRIIDAVATRFQLLLALYPSLGLTQQDIRAALGQVLGHDRFGPEFVRLLFTGTGGLIVEVVLTLTTLFYLYSQGPALARFLLEHLPLTPQQQLGLRLRFHRTVQHLLAETAGKALAIGITLGSIAWAVAGFNPVLVAVVGLFAGLMPVVGHAFVWLPLASLLASQGNWLDAWCLVIASWSAVWLIERATLRMAVALGTAETWLSFLLFLSVVGGALGYGARGLIIGPAAVISVVLLSEFIGSLYGRSAAEQHSPDGGS